MSKEPEPPPEFGPPFAEVRAQRECPTQKLHCVAVHLALQIRHAKPVVRVQRRPWITAVRGDPGQVLDRLAHDPLAQTHHPDGHVREAVLRLALDHAEAQLEGVVEPVLVHQRPSE